MSTRRRTVPRGLVLAAIEDGRWRYEQAAAAGVNAGTYSGILTGRVQPTAEQRVRIAAALGRPEASLFGDLDETVTASS